MKSATTSDYKNPLFEMLWFYYSYRHIWTEEQILIQQEHVRKLSLAYPEWVQELDDESGHTPLAMAVFNNIPWAVETFLKLEICDYNPIIFYGEEADIRLFELALDKSSPLLSDDIKAKIVSHISPCDQLLIQMTNQAHDDVILLLKQYSKDPGFFAIQKLLDSVSQIGKSTDNALFKLTSLLPDETSVSCFSYQKESMAFLGEKTAILLAYLLHYPAFVPSIQTNCADRIAPYYLKKILKHAVEVGSYPLLYAVIKCLKDAKAVNPDLKIYVKEIFTLLFQKKDVRFIQFLISHLEDSTLYCDLDTLNDCLKDALKYHMEELSIVLLTYMCAHATGPRDVGELKDLVENALFIAADYTTPQLTLIRYLFQQQSLIQWNITVTRHALSFLLSKGKTDDILLLTDRYKNDPGFKKCIAEGEFFLRMCREGNVVLMHLFYPHIHHYFSDAPDASMGNEIAYLMTCVSESLRANQLEMCEILLRFEPLQHYDNRAIAKDVYYRNIFEQCVNDAVYHPTDAIRLTTLFLSHPYAPLIREKSLAEKLERWVLAKKYDYIEDPFSEEILQLLLEFACKMPHFDAHILYNLYINSESTKNRIQHSASYASVKSLLLLEDMRKKLVSNKANMDQAVAEMIKHHPDATAILEKNMFDLLLTAVQSCHRQTVLAITKHHPCWQRIQENKANYSWYELFESAIEMGYADLVRNILYEQEPAFLGSMKDHLFLACKKGHEAIVRLIFEHPNASLWINAVTITNAKNQARVSGHPAIADLIAASYESWFSYIVTFGTAEPALASQIERNLGCSVM